MLPTRRSKEGASLRRFAAGCAVALAAVLAGCSEQPAPPAAPQSATGAAANPLEVPAPQVAMPTAAPANDHELGRAVWNYRCYFCHGYSGDAKTLATTYLDPKPRNFRETAMDEMPRERILAAVRHGTPGTAMAGFTGIISEKEMQAVTDFVRKEFMEDRAENTRYHTAANGWPNHERHEAAFPFARGDIAIDTPWEQLDPRQQQGLRLFRSTCITCHDHGKVQDPGKVWESRALSYPRDAYCTSCHQDVPRSVPGGNHPQRPATHTFAAVDGSVPVRSPDRPEAVVASNFLVHDKAPVLVNPGEQVLQGERLFQKNCAFCHAAAGTSRGWIGTFLQPNPRDLTSPEQMRGMTRERLLQSIREGLPDTSMPAWKSVMSEDEIEALVAYIDRAFHPVAGMERKQAAAGAR